MFEAHITNQHLTLLQPNPVADSINYLAFRFRFTPDWDGLDKWAHFEKDGAVYDIPLTGDEILPEDGLNLTEGTWNLYLHGDSFSDGAVVRRITTDQKSFTVTPTGTLEGQPFGEIIPSVAEQILARLTELEKDSDFVTMSEVRVETGKNHYTKAETDIKLAEKAPGTMRVYNEYGTTDYTSEEIIEHLQNGGCTMLADVDLGGFPYLWSHAGTVFYGGIIPHIDKYIYICFAVSGNTATTVMFDMAEYVKLSDLEPVLKAFSDRFDEHYTKAEIDTMFGSYVNDIAELIGGEAIADS